jgi:prevent-host-death family protein
MRIAPLADVKARLSAYIEQSETEGPVVITRNGKAVAIRVFPYRPFPIRESFCHNEYISQGP